MMRPAREKSRPGGVALLMALSLLMLLTLFLSEYFFATGLELQGMTTFREGQQARALGRSVFRVVQIGLRMDEVEFFDGYGQVKKVLDSGVSIPWDDGLLLTLEVKPVDHLYNLNQVYNQRQGEDNDVARSVLFLNLLDGLEVPGELPESEPEVLREETMQGLYAALFDWIDADDEDYIQFPGVLGAEVSAYFGQRPEVIVKNGMFDRLEEIRVVRGVRESRIPWQEWQARFTALPRVTDSSFYFTEKINANIASRDEIVDFLTVRNVNPDRITGNAFKPIQEGINAYSEKAEEIGESMDSEIDGKSKVYSKADLEALFKGLGLNEKYGVNHLFSTINQYYVVSIETEVGGVGSRLEGLVEVPRDENTRIAKALTKVHWVTQR